MACQRFAGPLTRKYGCGVPGRPESLSMANKIRFANRHFQLPQSKPLRVGFGILLLAGGLMGFLPVLGFWMIPLGLLVLSVDVPNVRRRRRRLAVWWHRDRKVGNEATPRPDEASGSKVE